MSLFSPERYQQALHFAGLKHGDQKEPGRGLPYVVHLTSVAMEVIASLAEDPLQNPDLAVACALLHDTIEDTDTTYDEVAERFGRDVADGVRALTKDPRLEKAEQMPDSLQRLRTQPREVQLVKLADRIVNLQPPPPEWNEAKKRRYRAEAKRIQETLGPASAPLASRLEEKIEAYEAYLEATGLEEAESLILQRDTLFARMVASIEELHVFFVSWFAGTVPRDDELFAERFESRLDPDFTLIPPRGVVMPRERLTESVRRAYGTNPAFRIKIRNPELRRADGPQLLATYEEWQRNAKASTPPDNGRIATVTVIRDDRAPQGLRWLHVHETWLPPEAIEAGPYDF